MVVAHSVVVENFAQVVAACIGKQGGSNFASVLRAIAVMQGGGNRACKLPVFPLRATTRHRTLGARHDADHAVQCRTRPPPVFHHSRTGRKTGRFNPERLQITAHGCAAEGRCLLPLSFLVPVFAGLRLAARSCPRAHCAPACLAPGLNATSPFDVEGACC